jgi:hypothetical protein
MRDRQRAILQFHELPDLDGNMLHTPNPNNALPGGQTMSLPFAPKQGGMSALETLAEVSRQHLDMSGKRTPKDKRNSSQHPTVIQNGNYLDEFLVQDDRPDEPVSMAERIGTCLCRIDSSRVQLAPWDQMSYTGILWRR